MIGAPWLEVAVRELAAGVLEIPGPEHNLRILEYHGATSLKATTDEVPWCSAFVNWCLRQAWCKGTHSAMARSFAGWGVQSPVRVGAVAVFWRGNPQGPQGHVGFVLGANPDRDMLYVLGGNQSNRVCVRQYHANRMIGLRWPREAT